MGTNAFIQLVETVKDPETGKTRKFERLIALDQIAEIARAQSPQQSIIWVKTRKYSTHLDFFVVETPYMHLRDLLFDDGCGCLLITDNHFDPMASDGE